MTLPPMRRESPYPMLPIDEARSLIVRHTPLLPAESISSLAADGRVLAEDVFAPDDVPDVPKSAVDGYALRAADGRAPRQVLAELTAGGAGMAALPAGAAVRIMTGAPVPPGADAVIMVEQTEEQGGVVQIQRTLQPGDFIHQPGQDIRAGELILGRGAVLGAAEIGLLASLGKTAISAFRRPVVAVLATGDEVFEPDALPDHGGIRDSNRYALMAAVREAGAVAVSLGIARDDEATQRNAMLRGLAEADVLLTSGGVSMGTRDLIKPLLAELGTVHFGRVAYKPGKPTTFATIGDKLAFGLPGYPVSSLVSFEMFVRPALRRMQGDAHPERPRVRVALAAGLTTDKERPECQRAVIRWEDGRLVAHSTGGQGSSRLLSLRGANGLLLLPAGGQHYAAGDEVEALLVGPVQ